MRERVCQYEVCVCVCAYMCVRIYVCVNTILTILLSVCTILGQQMNEIASYSIPDFQVLLGQQLGLLL
jgi:hypothetical protein